MPNIKVNATELFFEQAGNSMTPLILLHGNGEDHTIFKKLIPMLAEHFTVFAIDSRGHGKSAKTDSLDYQVMADDVVAFIAAMGMNQMKPVLYGFSDGGIIGLLIASQHPDLLSRLIISGANLNPQGLKPKWVKLFKLMYKMSKDPKLQMMLTQPNITITDLSKITVPTLVLAGSKDMILEEHTGYIASHIGDSTLHILPKEGHASYVVKSTKLYPIIMEFCQE